MAVVVLRRTLVGMLTVLALAVPAIADAASRHLGDRVLKAGMHGQDVRVLQDFLTRAGLRDRRRRPVRPGDHARRAQVRALQRPHRRRRRRRERRRGACARPASSADGGFQGDQVTPVSDSPTARASLASDGTAIAPATAPPEVQAVIAAANEIAKKPYRYGGGHGRFNDTGYDCSGSVSYALHGASLVEHPLDSTDFKSWGDRGRGDWITIYTNAGHAFMVVAGLRFDTSGKTRHGSRWQRSSRSARGYVVRHPDGL